MPLLNELRMIVGPDFHNLLVTKYNLTEHTRLHLIHANDDHEYHIAPTEGDGHAIHGTMQPVQWMTATRWSDYDEDNDVLYLEP